MAWDNSRPVPWRRLMREWLIYVAVATVAFVVYYKATHKQLQVGLFAGLLSSGPMYVLFGAVMAKFGYQRKTMKDLRQQRTTDPPTRKAAATSAATTAGIRSKPAPTKRTSTGPAQHRKGSKPKRR
ncbi:MAG TPA: hypothetical protein VGM78_04010 [Ilumatobacteraceae bacterium]|jgi:hypothetical protein